MQQTCRRVFFHVHPFQNYINFGGITCQLSYLEFLLWRSLNSDFKKRHKCLRVMFAITQKFLKGMKVSLFR